MSFNPHSNPRRYILLFPYLKYENRFKAGEVTRRRSRSWWPAERSEFNAGSCACTPSRNWWPLKQQRHTLPLNPPPTSQGREEVNKGGHLSPACHSRVRIGSPKVRMICSESSDNISRRPWWKQRPFFQSPETDQTLMEYKMIKYDFVFHHPDSLICWAIFINSQIQGNPVNKGKLWKQCAGENARRHN